MPQAVGDNVPRGGRSGEPKARTGGAAGSPPGRFASGAEGGKWALLLSSAVGFSTAGGVKSFFKVKDARARYGFWKPYDYWPAGMSVWVKVRNWCV